MKTLAEIAKTKYASIVQKENTLIDIKIKLNLPSPLIPHTTRVRRQRASITGYNKNIQVKVKNDHRSEFPI